MKRGKALELGFLFYFTQIGCSVSPCLYSKGHVRSYTFMAPAVGLGTPFNKSKQSQRAQAFNEMMTNDPPEPKAPLMRTRVGHRPHLFSKHLTSTFHPQCRFGTCIFMTNPLPDGTATDARIPSMSQKDDAPTTSAQNGRIGSRSHTTEAANHITQRHDRPKEKRHNPFDLEVLSSLDRRWLNAVTGEIFGSPSWIGTPQ